MIKEHEPPNSLKAASWWATLFQRALAEAADVDEAVMAANLAFEVQPEAEFAVEGEEPIVKKKYSSTQFNLKDAGFSGVNPVHLFREMSLRLADEDLADDGREEKPHITVKYGLHTEDSDEVQQVVRDFGSVYVVLGDTFIFPGEEYDVVNVRVKSSDIRRLNKLISDSLPHTDTHPNYVPHMCLGYVKPGLGEKYAGMDDLNGTELIFPELTFSSSVREHTDVFMSLMSADAEFAVDGEEGLTWITLGGHAEGEAKHKGGFHVAIDKNGVIRKGGTAGLHGTHVSDVKTELQHEDESDDHVLGNERPKPKTDPTSDVVLQEPTSDVVLTEPNSDVVMSDLLTQVDEEKPTAESQQEKDYFAKLHKILSAEGPPGQLEVLGNAEPERIAETKKGLDALSVNAKKLLKNHGVRVKVLDEEYGKVMGNAAGSYSRASKVLVSGTAQDVGQTAETCRHELGHAVDDALGQPSLSKEFSAALANDMRAMNQEQRKRYNYYIKHRTHLEGYPVENAEVFAQNYAALTGQSEYGEDYMQAFKNTLAFMRSQLEPEGLL